jgi:hypothetical protein
MTFTAPALCAEDAAALATPNMMPMAARLLDEATSWRTGRWVMAKVEFMPGVVFPGGFYRDPPGAFKAGNSDQEELPCINLSAGYSSRSLPR